MKICKIRMENFRSFKDETIIFNDYNCFVGPNGSGKSTVLSALNIFFRNTMTATGSVGLNEEDFHNKDTSKQIIITVWFDELNDDAKEELSTYVRQGLLVVKAKANWDESSATAVVEQYGSRLVMSDFKKYF